MNSETNVEANSNRPINTKQVSYQQLPAKEKNEVKQLVLLDKFQISQIFVSTKCLYFKAAMQRDFDDLILASLIIQNFWRQRMPEF